MCIVMGHSIKYPAFANTQRHQLENSSARKPFPGLRYVFIRRHQMGLTGF
jgi:hypothetical protein